MLKKKGGYKSNKDLADVCCVAVPTVRNWLAGIVPRSRDNFIKIGFAEKSDLEQMNNLLQRYGYQALYSKNYEDAVYKFVLQNKDRLPECGYRYCRKIIEMIKDDVENEQDAMNFPTTNLDERLGGMRDVPELTTFICDVKPSNIFVKSSKEAACLLGDFSISLDDSQKKIVNEYSIGYSSPEQLKKIAEPLSNRSDIYSLGMTLYVLANNKKFPDQHDVLPEIEEISVELNAILRKACSYYPGNRYQSAAELRKELLKLMITKYC